MSWFKVDDRLFCHPKWLACSPHARALWVTAGSWAGAQEDRGKVPRHVLSMLGGRPKDAAELERNGLWEATDDGWIFHDWAQFQPTPEQVAAKRAAAAERQQRARDRKRESRRDVDVTHGGITDPPTRPVPKGTPQAPRDAYVRPEIPLAREVMAGKMPNPSEVVPPPSSLRRNGSSGRTSTHG